MIHDMTLIETDPDGTELWECPICSRRLRICWTPYHVEVIVFGNTKVGHTGTKFITRIAPLELMELPSAAEDESELLKPWKHL